MVSLMIAPGKWAALCLILLLADSLQASVKVSLAQMPTYALSANDGVLVDLIKAVGLVTEHQVSIEVFPFYRSIHNVMHGDYDIHVPLIKNNLIEEDKLPFRYSTATLFYVNFVIYTLEGSAFDLRRPEDFVIESDRAHIQYFPFEAQPSDSILRSLKKLYAKRIDAYIFADSATDPVLEGLKYKGIKRTLYHVFEVKAVLARDKKALILDQWLSEGIQSLKQKALYESIILPINQPFAIDQN